MLSALAFLVLFLFPTVAVAQSDPEQPQITGEASELPGSGASPMLLAAAGGYLLTGGLALLLLRR